jgi:WD40 repeat protein
MNLTPSFRKALIQIPVFFYSFLFFCDVKSQTFEIIQTVQVGGTMISDSWDNYVHDIWIDEKKGIFCATSSGKVIVHSLAEKDTIIDWSFPEDRPHHLGRFSPDGNWFCVGGKENSIYVYHKEESSFSLRHVLNGHQTSESMVSLAFHPTKPILVSAAPFGELGIWDYESGYLIRMKHLSAGALMSVDFNPQGTLISAGSGTSECIFYDWMADTITGTVNLKRFQPETQYAFSTQIPSDLLFTPAGDFAYMLIYNGLNSLLEGYPDGEYRPLLLLPQVPAEKRKLHCFTWSHERKQLIAGCENGDLLFIDPHSNVVTQVFKTGLFGITDIEVSADGRYIVAGGKSGIVKVIGIKSGATSPESE